MKTKEKKKKKTNSALKFLEKYVEKDCSLNGFIKDIRVRKEMTQAEFAKLLGISVSHLSDIENKRRNVGPKRAEKFAKILDVPSHIFIQLSLSTILENEGLDYDIKVS